MPLAFWLVPLTAEAQTRLVRGACGLIAPHPRLICKGHVLGLSEQATRPLSRLGALEFRLEAALQFAVCFDVGT